MGNKEIELRSEITGLVKRLLKNGNYPIKSLADLDKQVGKISLLNTELQLKELQKFISRSNFPIASPEDLKIKSRKLNEKIHKILEYLDRRKKLEAEYFSLVRKLSKRFQYPINDINDLDNQIGEVTLVGMKARIKGKGGCGERNFPITDSNDLEAKARVLFENKRFRDRFLK